MSEYLIRAQIKAIMESVSGIGVVHDYMRYPRSLADLLDLMTVTPGTTVNGWTIHRASTPASPLTMGPSGLIERSHKFEISGLHELNDASASEITFQAICDAIFEAFKTKPTLNGTAIRHDHIQIESVSINDAREFGKDAYHTAELSLVVYERVTKSP